MAKTTTAVTKATPKLPSRLTQSVLNKYPEIQRIEDNIALVDLVFEKMEEGVDYGVVPGVPKPFLFKAGAERLALYFGLRLEFEIDDRSDIEADTFYYKVTTKVTDKEGNYLGMGVGSCSSNESKYKYRWVAYNNLPSNMKTGDVKSDAQNYIDTHGSAAFRFSFGKVPMFRIENDMVADLANTVLKMAVKRSKSDAIQTVTGADRKFMRIEELEKPFEEPLEPADLENIETGEIQDTEPATPASKATEPKTSNVEQTTEPPVDYISDKEFSNQVMGFAIDLKWSDPTLATWIKANADGVSEPAQVPVEKRKAILRKLADMVASK